VRALTKSWAITLREAQFPDLQIPIAEYALHVNRQLAFAEPRRTPYSALLSAANGHAHAAPGYLRYFGAPARAGFQFGMLRPCRRSFEHALM